MLPWGWGPAASQLSQERQCKPRLQQLLSGQSETSSMCGNSLNTVHSSMQLLPVSSHLSRVRQPSATASSLTAQTWRLPGKVPAGLPPRVAPAHASRTMNVLPTLGWFHLQTRWRTARCPQCHRPGTTGTQQGHAFRCGCCCADATPLSRQLCACGGDATLPREKRQTPLACHTTTQPAPPIRVGVSEPLTVRFLRVSAKTCMCSARQ